MSATDYEERKMHTVAVMAAILSLHATPERNPVVEAEEMFEYATQHCSDVYWERYHRANGSGSS